MINPFPFKGLSDAEVFKSREEFGGNSVTSHNENSFLLSLKEAFTEPMFLMLVACSAVYLLLGEYAEAFFMMGAIIIVAAISIFQETRNRNALRALSSFVQPEVKVIRNNELLKIKSADIVVGEYIVVNEGELVSADGVIQQCNDCYVNEAILTGESLPVLKNSSDSGSNLLYSGTFVESGQAVFIAKKIGAQTSLSKIGESIQGIKTQKSPLQLQIDSFVKWMAGIGIVVFLLIWLINFNRTGNIFNSLLQGLTIAMSILPEEIPVAFSTFMALGAWRLMSKGVVVKNPLTVESLGSATVICTDKTGTITENRMDLHSIYLLQYNQSFHQAEFNDPKLSEILSIAMWASETVPFDRMEKTLHQLYEKYAEVDERNDFIKIKEYPLSGIPPMMTHVFENKIGKKIIACKGAPEAVIKSSELDKESKDLLMSQMGQMTNFGLRVLAVGVDDYDYPEFPEDQAAFKFRLLGLVGFFDPPKENISSVFEKLSKAGIKLKIISGDNSQTTMAIASMANFPFSTEPMVGEEIMNLPEEAMKTKVNETQIFTRVFPEAKLKVINSLISNGEIVAMTGDGVNDGPALKAAHIGIAMGKKGSEIAKQAASLVLADDDLSRMVEAVALGRKIYENLKKAIQYIISIHIPIILSVAVPIICGWKFPNVFSPIHVIFLELIMGPTCSIAYENEPADKNSMSKPPREIHHTFFRMNELIISLLQGLMITIGVLFVYHLTMTERSSEIYTRTMVFTTLIFANIMLTLVNRSFYYSFIATLRNKNHLIGGILMATLLLLLLMVYVHPINQFFGFLPLDGKDILLSSMVGLGSVIWFEGYKFYARNFQR